MSYHIFLLVSTFLLIRKKYTRALSIFSILFPLFINLNNSILVKAIIKSFFRTWPFNHKLSMTYLLIGVKIHKLIERNNDDKIPIQIGTLLSVKYYDKLFKNKIKFISSKYSQYPIQYS